MQDAINAKHHSSNERVEKNLDLTILEPLRWVCQTMGKEDIQWVETNARGHHLA